MSRVLRALLFILGVCFPAHAALAQQRPQLASAGPEDVASYLSAAPLKLRTTLTASPVLFVETPDGLAGYRFDPSPLYPVPSRGTAVEVVGTGGQPAGEIEVRLRDSRRRKGSVWLFPPPGQTLGPASVQLILNAMFELSPEDSAHKPYVLNTESGMVHALGCNHLPSATVARAFASMDAATGGGARACRICFAPQPDIFDYHTERAIGRAVAGRIRSMHGTSLDLEANSRVQRAADRVLKGWPRPLRGYSYRFEVLEDDAPQAIACPAGIIFVTKGLLGAVESEDELDAALAHEIAHVELRHGYHQYRRALTAKGLTALFALTVGLIAGANTDNAGTVTSAMDIAAIVGNVVEAIVLQGYSRSDETEADLYAASFLLASGSRDQTPLVTLLSRLKFYRLSVEKVVTNATTLSSHPTIDARMSLIEAATVKTYDSTATWTGFDGQGTPIVTVRLDFDVASTYTHYESRGRPGVKNLTPYASDPRVARHYVPVQDQAYRLFTRITVLPTASSAVPVGTLLAKVGTRTQSLSADQLLKVEPGEEAFVAFESRGQSPSLRSGIEHLQLQWIGATLRWQRSDDL